MSTNILSEEEPNLEIEEEVAKEEEPVVEAQPTLVPEMLPEQEQEQEPVEEAEAEESPKKGFTVLLLGDIIRIHDPTNDILDKNTFIIDYIDQNKIKLYDEESNFVQLNIDENGVIDNGTIRDIELLSRNTELGYARQNKLLPNTWINIHFSGDLPTILTGKITNLEEDMIEIQEYPSGDMLYINFGYKGIPEELPIAKFEIRNPPETSAVTSKVEELGEEDVEPDFAEGDIELEISSEGLPERFQQPMKEVRTKLDKMIVEADQIEFGEYLEEIEEAVMVGKEKYRYNLEAQTNDMLEEMLSKVPSTQRTPKVMSSINTIINRFVELRRMGSVFDKNGNIIGFRKIGASYKPLVDELSEMKQRLYWILYVVKNIKKIYKEDDSEKMPEYDDITLIDPSNKEAMLGSYIQQMSSNEGFNYTELYTGINNILTPFKLLDPESLTNILYDGPVNTDMMTVVDNNGDLRSSTFTPNGIFNKDFFMQRYNTGLKRLTAENFKGSKLITETVPLMPNDIISVSSLITLPEPFIKFSKVNLPSTDILTRANLSEHFIHYWKLLNKTTKLTQVEIDDLEIEFDYDENNFLDNIKHFHMNLDEEAQAKMPTNKAELFQKFLDIVVPKTSILFKLVKKYINGRLSVVEVINFLEPFLIYADGLTFMQYLKINEFLRQKIAEYNKNYVESSRYFSSIKNMKTDKTAKPKIPQLVSNDPNIKNLLDDTYKLSQTDEGFAVTDSEILAKILRKDKGNLFNASVALQNIALMFPKELDQLFERDMRKNKDNLELDEKQNSMHCNKYVMAKRYRSAEELKADNDVDIYFDKEFDKTDYELTNDKDFIKQQKVLSPDELLIYITDKVQRKYKLSETEAEYMAEAILTGYKKVRDGDYAVLTLGTEHKYFVRKESKWMLDEKVGADTFEVSDDGLCLLQPNCLYKSDVLDGDCDSADINKDNLVAKAMKKIIDEFDKTYEISQKELNEKLKEHIERFHVFFERIENIDDVKFYATNKFKYELGVDIKELDLDIKVSPYAKLRDIILGQSDFSKRQNDICVFVSKFTRYHRENVYNENDKDIESPDWLYCYQTDVKLLPYYVWDLAYAFKSGIDVYNNKMNIVIKKYGKLNSDGDAWIDSLPESGRIIKMVDFDVEEGYEDGFKASSRGALEEDVGDVLSSALASSKIFTSPTAQIISNIMTAFTHQIGVNIEQQREFVVKTVTTLLSDVNVIEDESTYNKRMASRSQEEQMKRPAKPYTFVFNSALLYLTLGAILVAIQTSIPSIKTRKTFPGCVRSFYGYPIQGEGDDSALNYVACVALGMKSATPPWNVLAKIKDKDRAKVAETLKFFISKYLLVTSDVDRKIRDKLEYLIANPDKDIPNEHSLLKWTTFMPSLNKFKIPIVQNIGEGFKDELVRDIKLGSPDQHDKEMVIDGKIIQFTYALQQCIQKILEKKDLLMRSSSSAYTDNACCNDGTPSESVLDYFMKEDGDIDRLRRNIAYLGDLQENMRTLGKAIMFVSSEDTKRKQKIISNTYEEDTIYRGFIVYCKFLSNSLIPLSDEIQALCQERPEYLTKSDSLAEHIRKLKRDGKNYTAEDFTRLLQLVNRNNIIKNLNMSPEYSYTAKIRGLLKSLNDVNDETISTKLRQHLEILMDTYDISIKEDDAEPKELRSLKNYLHSSISKMRAKLLDFIKKKSKVSSNDYKKIEEFITNLMVWDFDVDKEEVDERKKNKISNDGMYNYINFTKTFTTLFAKVFPQMILNSHKTAYKPKAYLGLSRNHAKDLIEMVEEYHKPLEVVYGDKTLTKILREVSKVSDNLLVLMKETPALTDIKIEDKRTYSVFDKRTSTLLFEYYLLEVLSKYIELSNDKLMIVKEDDNQKDKLFSNEYMTEQAELLLGEDEEFMKGQTNKLKKSVAKVLVAFINIMMESKNAINISYDKVMDNVFKLKEREKDTFTDRLKALTDEAREVDTIMKINKLGVWHKGLEKGLVSYDADNFDQEREQMLKIAGIKKKIMLQNPEANNDNIELLIEDYVADEANGAEIDRDAYDMSHMGEDYQDGDYYGDESEAFGDNYS